MALTNLQSRILRLLAAHRDPESYVAGSTPLHRGAFRFSDDIDIFHDREERVSRTAAEDAETLRREGLDIVWVRREPAIHTATISDGVERTHLEWVADSDYRFFPAVKDELFGYVLHPIDLATNKVMAAAGRRKPADVLDLIPIHENILPLGAVIWAAVEKAPGYTPEGLIAEIRRNSIYTAEELREVATITPVDPQTFRHRLREILDDAEAFVVRMPTVRIGILFLMDGKVVQPDPDRLDVYTVHAGQRRGHWPANSEITAAMFRHYDKLPLEDRKEIKPQSGRNPGQRGRPKGYSR